MRPDAAGDTISLSNELDDWKERAQKAEADLAAALVDARNLWDALEPFCTFTSSEQKITLRIDNSLVRKARRVIADISMREAIAATKESP